VTELALGEGARVEHIRVQNENFRAFHIASIQARLGRAASLDSRVVSLGAALSRVDIAAVLEGEGAECRLDGLFLASGSQHVDHHTVLDHAVPRGTSRQVYKGILAGAARGVFDGTIIVRPDAQKTDARQANRNLLLSDAALVNTKPQLEIRADDVKCAHAATIGRLDEASLFYLRSRGLAAEEARAALVRAFAAEVTATLAAGPLRERIEAEIARRITAAEAPEASR
jgi:Fe-S cluster assembly protein SufD